MTCLNVSTVQNRRNETLTAEQNLADRIEVVYGDFENLPYTDGTIVFTDPMQADNADLRDLQPVLERINLSSLGSPAFYRTAAADNGLAVHSFAELAPDQQVRLCGAFLCS